MLFMVLYSMRIEVRVDKLFISYSFNMIKVKIEIQLFYFIYCIQYTIIISIK